MNTNWTTDTIPHIVVPPEQWPRDWVYYYCPACHEVHGIEKTRPAVCPECGQKGLRDIFTEIAVSLQHAWNFFEATRLRPQVWLFKHSPEHPNYSLWASSAALGVYGELRAMGFPSPWGDDGAVIDAWTRDINQHIDPETGLLDGPCEDEAKHGSIASKQRYLSNAYEWNLRNRAFAADRYQAPPGQMTDEDHLRSRKAFLSYMETLDWDAKPWGCGSWLTRIIANHRQLLEAEDGRQSDELIEFVHSWLDEHQSPETGQWFGKNASHSQIVNGIFKIYVAYERQGWPIRYKKETIDFVLQGADPKRGFAGSGCSVFDPMMVLWVLRGRGEYHRAADVDEAVAKSFVTWLENWYADISWYKDGTWSGKHNNSIPAYMACLLLDQPYMKNCTIYNWRKGPIIHRNDDRISVNRAPSYSPE